MKVGAMRKLGRGGGEGGGMGDEWMKKTQVGLKMSLNQTSVAVKTSKCRCKLSKLYISNHWQRCQTTTIGLLQFFFTCFTIINLLGWKQVDLMWHASNLQTVFHFPIVLRTFPGSIITIRLADCWFQTIQSITEPGGLGILFSSSEMPLHSRCTELCILWLLCTEMVLNHN